VNPVDAALDEQAQIVVDWLRGQRAELPTHLGPPAPETGSLTDILVTLNQAGVVTLNSQPGTTGQRAYLTALVAPHQVDCICRLARDRGMLADHLQLTAPSAHFGSYRVSMPGTGTWTLHRVGTVDEPIDGGEPRIVEADPARTIRARDEALLLTPDPRIRAAYLLFATDPQWGREDALWDAMLAAASECVPQ